MVLAVGADRPGSAQPSATALADFDRYTSGVEARVDQQHRSHQTFLVGRVAQDGLSLRRGETVIEDLSPKPGEQPSGALIHHWRGSAFAPGATAADFERMMRDFNAYPRVFAPEVFQARLLSVRGDDLQVSMRVQQRHVLTVVLDATYDVRFGRLDPQHRLSVSRSRSISELDVGQGGSERVLSADEEHGFLWRQNTYWSCEERDGGVYLQVESISLTRAIPRGLGWVIGPYVQSIPRESLEFTLRSTMRALRR